MSNHQKEVISVLIPTYNAAKYIEPLIGSLQNQQLSDIQELEIIIIDSSSTDDTVNLIKTNYPDVNVIVIPNKSFDHGGSRNHLASLAKGDYLLFMTQDAVPYNEYLLQNLVKSFQDPEVLIAYARQLPKEDAHPLEVFARNFNYPNKAIKKGKNTLDELGIKTFFNSNVCSMYKKELFDQYGGFPEKIILNEDMILASKVILDGKYVHYNNEAIVYHSHNYSLKQQFKRYFDIGMAFSDTSYLLKYASNEKEGMKMVKTQLRYLISEGKALTVPYAILESAVKLSSYKLGKKHSILPYKLKKSFSAYMK